MVAIRNDHSKQLDISEKFINDLITVYYITENNDRIRSTDIFG